MYNEFLIDELTEKSKLFKYLKMGLSFIDESIWESDYKDTRSTNIYKIIDNFFNSCNHDFDEVELLFIYNIIYNVAGFEESIHQLASFLGLEIDVDINEQDLILSIDVKSNIFKDSNLSLAYLKEVVNDLLFFKELDLVITKITLNINIINEIYNLSYTNNITNVYYTPDELLVSN